MPRPMNTSRLNPPLCHHTTAISVGYRPEKMLARELEHMRLPYKAIGDCVVPGKILDAMHQGLAAAYAL